MDGENTAAFAKKAGWGLGLGSFFAVLWGIDPTAFEGHLSATMAHDVTKFGLVFSLAAWIHSSRVKKEIASQTQNIVASIDNVAVALRDDLMKQGNRIGQVESGMAELKTTVKKINGRLDKLAPNRGGESETNL